MSEKQDPKPARRTKEAEKSEATEVATAAAAATIERIGELGAEVAANGPLTLGETAADSAVSDELTGNGVAFGEMVKSVGLAVAAAQSALDKTLVDTAKALSDTKIETVAIFEQKIKDDDGTMEAGEVHLQTLPLTNYIMPTAYMWSRVYLEADANVQEFNSRTGFNIQQKSFNAGTSFQASASPFGLGGSVRGGVSFGSNSTGVDTSVSSDLAAGKLHMEATLEPRGDIEVPKPFILQKGPRMQLNIGARESLHQDNDPTKPVTGTKVTLTVVLQKTDGSPMEAGKALSVNLSESTLQYDMSPSGQTDSNGKMTITIKREGAAFDPTTAVGAVVRVSFGLVTASAGIAL
jgi:hypothetical protein